jgi:hypothetical protein
MFNSSTLKLDIVGVPSILIFDANNVKNQIRQGQLLYPDSWINYTCIFNTTGVFFIVDDFT